MRWPWSLPNAREANDSAVEFDRRQLLQSIEGRIERLETAPPPTIDASQITRAIDSQQDRLGALDTVSTLADRRLGALERAHTQMTQALADGIERNDRAERRVRAVVARARKELADSGVADPGLEAESQQLRLLDGEGSEAQGVSPVPAVVGDAAHEASSVKGVTVEQLRHVRGY